MIRVHHSNRLEALLEVLDGLLARPPRDPLAPEPVVVQHPGMGRWLAQQLALRGGIAANLDFPLPAVWVWQALRLWLPELPGTQALSRDGLLWNSLALLPEQLHDPAFAQIAHYLRDDEDGSRRYQLAGRIAELFDQYLVYRPDWVRGWEAGRDQHWQARLWRAIRARCPAPHWAGVLLDFLAALKRGAPPQGPLPERVCLFGLSALSPAYLSVLHALSEHCAIEFFYLNPCREYWADLLDEKGQARRRARAHRDEGAGNGLLDLGNPLLASLGHAGQALLDQLLEAGSDDQDAFVDPGDTTLLTRLQQDILTLRDRRSPDRVRRTRLDPEDRSLQIHVCHSPMREVQVLQDQLLHLFQTCPGLQPRDILVMAPDIDSYAPLIAAVFGAAEPGQAIPWSIADRSPTAELPVLRAFGWLLGLPTSRLEASAVLDLLEVPAIGRRFGVAEGGIERIRTWVRETGIRWGRDAAMRQDLGLPPESANSWAFGLERLFVGYALPPGAGRFQGVAPYGDLEGASAADLGSLAELLERLSSWQGRLRGDCDAQAWRARLEGLLGDLFDPDEEEAEALQGVRDALEALVRETAAAEFTAHLSPAILRERLLAQIGAPRGSRHFITGRVTCCSLVPMRSIPFRAVYLLGMNAEDFPRQQRPPDFDLMAQSPRRGDRSRRQEDRYLFLEALLSARERIHFSYVGRSVRDNSLKVPAAPLGELLDYLQQSLVLPSGEDPLPRLTLEHPLQPFSRRYFDGSDPRLLSYAQEWLAAADRDPDAEPPAPFALAPLPDMEPLETLELEALIRFLCNPAAHFLQRRLGVRLPEEQQALADEEPFTFDTLERYGLRQRLVTLADAGEDWLEVLTQLRAEGALPHGAFARLWVEDQQGPAETFLGRWQALRGPHPRSVTLELEIDGVLLTGQLGDLGPEGLVRARFTDLKAKDRLRLWVHHLALHCLAPADVPLVSTHLAEKAELRLGPVAEAPRLLADLIGLYREGLTRPLPFFPECSWHWLAKGFEGGFWTRWLGSPFSGPPGEGQDPWVRIAFRDADPFDDSFQALAARIYGPLRTAAGDGEDC